MYTFPFCSESWDDWCIWVEQINSQPYQWSTSSVHLHVACVVNSYQLQRRIYRYEWSSQFDVCNLSSCENKALKNHDGLCNTSRCSADWAVKCTIYLNIVNKNKWIYTKEQILQCWEIWIHSRLIFFRLYLHSHFYSCVHNCLGHLCL